MINHELIVVNGSYKKEKLGRTKNASNFQKHVTYALDGYRLDDLQITFNIKSKVDAEYLIADLAEFRRMLEIHKHCFDNPYEVAEMLKREKAERELSNNTGLPPTT